MIDEQLHEAAIDELIEAHVRITNLEKIAQALADELMAQDDGCRRALDGKDEKIKFLLDERNGLAGELRRKNDYIDGLIVDYGHALDTLENEEVLRSNAEAVANTLADKLESYEQKYSGGYRKPGNMGGVPDYEDWIRSKQNDR